MRVRVALLALLMSGAAAWAGTDGVLDYPASFFAEARPNTAYDMITRLPGFTFDDGNSARGFAGTAGNVLIDGGRPTAKTDDLQSILARIPASDVERIEVIRGGAQGIDMHGQSVVANVVRKKADSTQIVADVSNNIWPNGHMVPAASIAFTRHAGDSTYEASLSQIANYNDIVGWGSDIVTDERSGAVQYNTAQNKGMGLGWGLTGAAEVPLWGGKFKANIAYQDAPFLSANNVFGESGNWSVKDNSGSQKGELGLHWSGKLGGAAELETLYLQRLGRSTDRQISDAPGDDEIFSNQATTAESILRATLRTRPSESLTLETGGEGVYNLPDGTSSYAQNGTAVPLPSGDARVDEKRGEAFAQATWNFASAWKLETGARFEYSVISESGTTRLSREFFYPKPRLLLTWTPARETQIRLRYERVLGQLDFTNFVASSDLKSSGVSAGNPNLAPDRHNQIELSFERDFWNKGALVVTLLHEEIAGVLDYVPVTGPSGVFDAPGNIGTGHKDQIDTELTLPLDKLGMTNGLLKVTNIWRFTGVRDPATAAMRTISGVRPQDIEFTLTQDIESLKSTWGLYFFNCWDEHYYRPGQIRHDYVVPPYLELTWDYKPTPDWMVSLALRNPARFTYVDSNTAYTGLRGSAGPLTTDELRIKSQARLYVEIRKTL
jgi:hypothetical protein